MMRKVARNSVMLALLAAAACGGSGATSGSPTPSSATPIVSGFTPTSGAPGDVVTINGANFSGATAVSFGAATAESYRVLSDATLIALVPVGAQTAAISVSTGARSATSAGLFTVGAARNVFASNLVGLPSSAWSVVDPATGDTVTSIGYVSGSRAAVTEVGPYGHHFIQGWDTQWTSAPVMDAPYTVTMRLAAGVRTFLEIHLQSYNASRPGMQVDLTTCTATSNGGGAIAFFATPVPGQPNTCDVSLSAKLVSTDVSYRGASWCVAIGPPVRTDAASGVAFYAEDVRLTRGTSGRSTSRHRPAIAYTATM